MTTSLSLLLTLFFFRILSALPSNLPPVTGAVPILFSPISIVDCDLFNSACKVGGWERGGIWWGVLEETERGVKGPKIASHHGGWLKRKSSQLCCANLGSGRLFPPLLESLLVHVRCATRRTA